ncbi:MAG: ISNCY family transposase [Myxococcales bacterium]|nr:ISNCY family transposase [Myxococcales bacterium]
MSALEMDRMQVVQRVLEKRLTQAEAAMVLGLSQRQVRRLCQSMRCQGPRALVSRKRGRPSNRQLPEVVQEYAVGLISERYRDFGPTLAHEKLTELHGVRVSRETLRKWMIGAEIWTPRAQRGPRIHQPRRRRDCLGELVQIDGSDHEWFEGRGQRCTLLVFIDDATGRLMELRFVEVESAFDYFDATASYVRKHGKPAAFYSDKHSIFRVNQEGSTGAAKGVTQYGRALGELNIDIICANTAQAKGRVERMNKTLQDRLVKELRLHGISNAEDANAFVPAFMDAYNNRFERAPRSLHNAHRPLLEGEDLNLIFTWQEDRKLSQSLVVQFQRNSYLVEPTTETSKLAGKTVRVHLWKDGQVQLRHNNQPLSFALFDKSLHAPADRDRSDRTIVIAGIGHHDHLDRCSRSAGSAIMIT